MLSVSTDYIALNGREIDESLTGRNLEGSG
jgi:hypothetical protein